MKLSIAAIVLSAFDLAKGATLEDRQILGLCTGTTLPLPLCGSIFGSCGSGCTCVNVVGSIPIVGGLLGGILGPFLGGILPPGICSSTGSLPLPLTQCLELACTTSADCTACEGAVCTPLQGLPAGESLSVCLPPDFDTLVF